MDNEHMLFLCTYVVHLRKRKTKHGKLKAPSTSSITYWQIEKDMEPLSGIILKLAKGVTFVYFNFCNYIATLCTCLRNM